MKTVMAYGELFSVSHKLQNKMRVDTTVRFFLKEDVNVSVENGVLTIQGEKKVEVTEGQGKKKHCVECAYGSFLRTFALPSNADAEKIDASFKDGVLELSIAKLAQTKAKKVDIKAE